MRYSEITEQDYSYSGRLRRNDQQIVRAILQTYTQALTASLSAWFFTLNHFPEYSWILDKKNPDGCSARRPDIRCDFGTHILIIEVDEDKHGSYECSCENKRVMEISQDHGHRPIVFLRFNPDKYLTTDDVKIPSPWRLNKLGVMTLVKTREGDWNNRLVCLKDQIQYWIDNVTDKMVETVHLFY